ncbi:MAG: hypothetical protein HYY49_03400 [Ignavibacteriales bacterium]|nr:hypothetical protein [Ignavibacteriales bacterium]
MVGLNTEQEREALALTRMPLIMAKAGGLTVLANPDLKVGVMITIS